MNKSEWKVPKWPFLLTYVVAFIFAGILIFGTPRPISQANIYWAAACVILGSMLCCLPFILEYRASSKLLEINALTSVADQLGQLEKFAEQISTVTEQWVRVQENTQNNTDKTVTASREIAERMTAEIREFNEFQAKLNDNEKAALRLEVEKMHRAEGDWLQVVARILDHTYALHSAAVRSGQAEVAAQIGHFQNACRDVARRVGLTPFVAAAGETFHPERHRAHGVDNPPENSTIDETLAPGLTFQGRLVRPVLVSLRQSAAAMTEPISEMEQGSPAEPTIQTEPGAEAEPAVEAQPAAEIVDEKSETHEMPSNELRLETD